MEKTIYSNNDVEMTSDSTISQEIERIQNYFVSKIIKNDYKVLSIDRYSIIIEINEKYRFEIWICNGMYGMHFSDCNPSTFMKLPVIPIETKELIYNRHLEAIEKYQDDTLQAKRKQFEKLKKELGEI